jgi:hypothetical protein
MHLGCHVQCRYNVSSVDFVALAKLSSFLAASLKIFLMVSFSYPLAISLFANCLAMLMKSVMYVFCFQYHCRLPKIRLFRTPGGWAEVGGMVR